MNIIDMFRRSSGRSNLKKVSWDTSQYDFRTAEFIDATLCRSIYRNTNARYKLAGGLAKPVVNTYASFIGDPVVTASKKKKTELDAFIRSISDEAHIISLSEGMVGYWLKWDNDKKEVVYQAIPEDQIKYKLFDFDGITPIQVVVEQDISYYDNHDGNYNVKTTKRTIIFDKQNITTKYENGVPAGEKESSTIKHGLNRAPIAFKMNEHYSFEIEGHSELEPIEPYLAGYHDVMKNRLIEDKRTSRKKLLLKVHDAEDFRKNNLIINGYDADSEATFDFENFDAYVCTSRGESFEDISYLNPGQSANDSMQIAKILFQNIIETSNVPEWAFAAKLGASFASAKVQEPAFIKSINRKRKKDSAFWSNVVSLYMDIKDRATVSNSNRGVKIEWEEINLESPEIRSRIVSYMVNSVAKGVESGIWEFEEAREYMGTYISGLKNFGNYKEEFDSYMDRLKKVKEAAKSGSGSKDKDSDENQSDINYKERSKDE